MTISAFTGPLVTFGQAVSGDYNPEAGTSLFFGGQGILDPRPAVTYQPGQDFGSVTAGWLGTSNVQTLNSVPYTKGVAAVAAAANVTIATPMTLVSANSATTGVSIQLVGIINEATGVIDNNSGVGLVGLDTFASCTATVAGNVLTVTAVTSPVLAIGMIVLTVGGTITGVTPVGQTIMAYGTGSGGTGTYILSGSPGSALTGTVTLQTRGPRRSTVTFGSAQTIRLWNPQQLIARAVAITAAAGASGTVNFVVRGYDIYGYPMIESILAAANTQTLGKKAFKYIKSVTPDATDAQNYSVDTTDVFGLPLRSDTFGDILVNYSASLNPAVITANTGYVAAVTLAPTATTGDVRGTYTAVSATGVNRLVARQSPEPYNVGFITGLVGQTQYATGF